MKICKECRQPRKNLDRDNKCIFCTHKTIRGVEKKFRPLFNNAKVRRSADLNTHNSKIVVEKKESSKIYIK